MTLRLVSPIPDLLPADIVLSRTRGRASRWIRAFELLQSQNRDNEARFSHASLALGDMTTTPEVLQSLWRVTRTPVDDYEGHEIAVWRNVRLTHAERRNIASKALELTGDWYAPLKILLYVLDCLCGTSWFSRCLGRLSFKTCGNLVAWSYDRARPARFMAQPSTFGEPWQSVTPDILDDACRYSEDWREIYNSLPIQERGRA